MNGHPAVIMSCVYTVLAGTQGRRNHVKKDRLFEVAQRRRAPVVLLAEGGGGRPGAATLRRVCAPAAVPLRHPGLHGRPPCRANLLGPPLRPDVPHRRQPHRPRRHRVLRKGYGWGPGDGGRGLHAAPVHRRMADLGVRRDGLGGSGATGDAPGARADRGRGRTRAGVRGDGCFGLRAGPRHQHGGIR